MPLLHHAVVRPLARQGEALELARQADGVVADVDHLLHLALALGGYLAHLEGDQTTKVGLGRAQFLADQADELTPARRGHAAPFGEGPGGGGDGVFDRLGARVGDMADNAARDRRAYRAPTGFRGGVDAEAGEQGGGFLGDGAFLGQGRDPRIVGRRRPDDCLW